MKFVDPRNDLALNLGTNSNFTFTTDNPLSDLWGTSWERTYIDVKLAYRADASWAPAKYLGNLQVQFSASENSSYTWAGQFEINQINSTSVDGYIQLQYRFILPSHITSALQANPNYLKLMFSANPGAEFKVYDISFGDAGSEENRVLNLTSNQKSSAVSYSSFITNTGNFVDLSTLIVYKDENGERKYYSIRQESSYPMYLVEQWARLSAYEPGVETYYGIWRQCWSYLGKGLSNMKLTIFILVLFALSGCKTDIVDNFTPSSEAYLIRNLKAESVKLLSYPQTVLDSVTPLPHITTISPSVDYILVLKDVPGPNGTYIWEGILSEGPVDSLFIVNETDSTLFSYRDTANTGNDDLFTPLGSFTTFDQVNNTSYYIMEIK